MRGVSRWLEQAPELDTLNSDSQASARVRARYYVAGLTADEKARAAHFTPAGLARLMASLAAPKPGESVYDPAVGDGSLLMAARSYEPQVKAYGQELDAATAARARGNVPSAEIVVGDTLRAPGHLDEEGIVQAFDVVLANPPFAITSDWGYETWLANDFGRTIGSAIPPKRLSDTAWLLHCAASLSDVGRAAAILPLGVLFRGVNEQRIRRALVERDLIEAVIALPRGLFDTTPLAVCVIVLRQRKPGERIGQVLFIDTSGASRGVLPSDEILEAYRTGASKAFPARLVDAREVEAHDYNLTVSRYFAAEATPGISSAEALAQLRAATIELEQAQAAFESELESFLAR